MSTNIDNYTTPAEHTASDHSAITGVRTYQIGFGGDMLAAGTFYGPATLLPGPVVGPPPSPAMSHPIPSPGAIFGVSWSVVLPGGTFQLLSLIHI